MDWNCTNQLNKAVRVVLAVKREPIHFFHSHLRAYEVTFRNFFKGLLQLFLHFLLLDQLACLSVLLE
ncbi:hypothetical protein EDM60_03040 [Brevibacillus parabrevis]|nr:hypothetical protein EDM60_03040 [Brevibacillus parabrevis]